MLLCPLVSLCRKTVPDRYTLAAYVALNTTNNGPNYTTSRDTTHPATPKVHG